MNHDHHPPAFLLKWVAFVVFTLEDGKLQVTIWDVSLYFCPVIEEANLRQVSTAFHISSLLIHSIQCMVYLPTFGELFIINVPCTRGASPNPRLLRRSPGACRGFGGMAWWHVALGSGVHKRVGVMVNAERNRNNNNNNDDDDDDDNNEHNSNNENYDHSSNNVHQ